MGKYTIRLGKHYPRPISLPSLAGFCFYTIGSLESGVESVCMEETSNVRCELVSGNDVSHLEGELKTFIETFGFDPKREKATKDVLNTILWDWFNFMTDHIVDHLQEKKEWYKKERGGE